MSFLIDFLNNISGAELVALSSVLAILISQELDTDEINILGSFLSSLGDNLTTIGATEQN